MSNDSLDKQNSSKVLIIILLLTYAYAIMSFSQGRSPQELLLGGVDLGGLDQFLA